MRNIGIIDIGSNSIRLSVYRCEGQEAQVLLNRKEMSGLASYVKHGMMTEAGVSKACQAISAHKETLGNLGITEYYAFATASLRNVTNTEEAVSEIKERTGISIDVISGEEEGVLSLRGAAGSLKLKEGLLVDLGGGSTELVPFKSGKALGSWSVPAGSLSLYRKFVKDIFPDKKELKNIRKYYEELTDAAADKLSIYTDICGVGGTARAVCKLINAKGRVSSERFSAEELGELYDEFKELDRSTVDLILKIVPDRVHTIIPGVAALKVIVDRTECRTVSVSSSGVREGYLHEKVLSEK